MNWRVLCVLLVVANTCYYLWSHDYLSAFGWKPVQQHEPQRVEAQRNANALRVANVSGAAAANSSGLICLRAGLVPDDMLAALRVAAENALPEGSWRIQSLRLQERWIVYMGKYTDGATADKKRQELSRLGITKLLPLPSRLQPGLSLASSGTRAGAQAELAALNRRGVRTARVIQQQAGINGSYIQLDRVSPSLQLQLEALDPVLQGIQWQLCD